MRYYSSTASEKTLSSAVNTTDTTITIDNLTGLPASYPYTLVVDPDTASEEIMLVWGLDSGTTLKVKRGSDTYDGVAGGNGTAKQNHNSGAKVKHMITARDLQEPQDHIAASSEVHGLVSGDGPIVGESKGQTLTNKTISSSNNTISISSSNISDWTAQFNTKANIASPTFTGTVVLPSSTSIGSVDSTELGYLNGVTSDIQTQLNGKVAASIVDAKGDLIAATGSDAVSRLAVGTNGHVLTADSSTATGLKWAAVTSGGTGTVTSITAGTGLTGGTITTSGTIAIDSTVVTTTGTQTLTNKTVTSPTVSGLYLSDSSIVFEGSSADANETTLTVTNPTADRTITLPNATGTVVLGTSAMTLTTGTVDVSISSGYGIVTVSNANIGTSSKILLSIVDNDADGQYIINAEALISGSFDVYVKHISSGVISGVTITVHWLAIG